MPRLSKAQRDEAKRAAAVVEAQRLAGLLSSAPAEGTELLAPPSFIADPRLAPALIVWKELAPALAATGRLVQLDRLSFAMLCYWQAEFITAVDDILTRGYWFMAKATAGGERPWANPSVDRRDTAQSEINELAKRFGLTPLDRAQLTKARNAAAAVDDDELPLPLAAPTPEAVPTSRSRWAELRGKRVN